MNTRARASARGVTGGTGRGSAFIAPLLASTFAAALLTGCQTAERLGLIDGPRRFASDTGKVRPGGVIPADMNDPGPSNRSGMMLGSGQFFAQPTGRGRRRDADQGSFTLNLVDASVSEAAAAVLGDVFG